MSTSRTADARAALRAAHERFENVSVDLMCGIPGQSSESFARSLDEAVSTGAVHVSVYPLTVEPGTPFFRAVTRGEMPEPDDDTAADHMQLASRLLAEAGFSRYEVASYAKPGFESKHNSAYWTGVPYLGLGESAATMTQNAQRRMRVQDGQVVDDLDCAQYETEDLMLGMRLARGITDERLRAAAEHAPLLPDIFTGLVRNGLVVHEKGRWRRTLQCRKFPDVDERNDRR